MISNKFSLNTDDNSLGIKRVEARDRSTNYNNSIQYHSSPEYDTRKKSDRLIVQRSKATILPILQDKLYAKKSFKLLYEKEFILTTRMKELSARIM